MNAIGANAYIAFCEETAYGTTPATPAMTQLSAMLPGESISRKNEELLSNAITGARARKDSRLGNTTVSGSLPFELSINSLATILKHALGPVVTTGAAAPYTHTIKRGPLPVGLTIEKAFPDIGQYYRYTGCRIDSMSLQVGTSGFVTGDLAFIGQDEISAASALGTPTVPDHIPLAHFDAVFTSDISGVQVPAQVLSLNLNLNNGLDGQRVVGSRDIASLREGMGEITGTLTVLFENDDYLSAMGTGVEFNSVLTFTDDDTGDSLQFRLPRTVYTGGDITPKIASDKGIVLTLAIRGLYDTTTATDFMVTVVNDAAAI